MGARLINSPRRTKIGHVEAFPVLHMRSLRKSAMFSEGQRTEGHFRYPGASNAIDLRSEHDLKVLLKVGHADSATNMQVIGLTHRPTGFNGRRWYFVSQNGERAIDLFAGQTTGQLPGDKRDRHAPGILAARCPEFSGDHIQRHYIITQSRMAGRALARIVDQSLGMGNP